MTKITPDTCGNCFVAGISVSFAARHLFSFRCISGKRMTRVVSVLALAAVSELALGLGPFPTLMLTFCFRLGFVKNKLG